LQLVDALQDGLLHPCVGRHPHRERRIRGVDRGERTVPRVRSAGRAAPVAQLDGSSGESVAGPIAPTTASIAAAGKSPNSIPSLAPGTDPGESMWSAASPARAIIVNVSTSGPCFRRGA
jgi:hypothetical protein